MAETSLLRLWGRRTAYIGIALLIVFFQLLPLETSPRRWAAPDLLVALSLAWAVRRPSAVPVLSVAGVMLLADLMFQRPPGLWAALVVMSVEYLRMRRRGLRDGTFAAEWLSVALVLAMATLADRLILALTLAVAPPLGLGLMQLALTVAVYPLVAGLTHLAVGTRGRGMDDMGGMGRRA